MAADLEADALAEWRIEDHRSIPPLRLNRRKSRQPLARPSPAIRALVFSGRKNDRPAPAPRRLLRTAVRRLSTNRLQRLARLLRGRELR